MKYFFISLIILSSFLLVPKIHADSNQNQLTSRVLAYSKKFPVSLSSEESSLLSERCTLIQSKLKDAITSVDQSTATRESSYEFIESKLYSIQSRFSNQQLDTSIIDLMLASYRLEISNFKIQALTYRNILDDAVEQDCAESPDKFKSTILAAREARELVQESMIKIRALYNSSISSGFKSLTDQMTETNARNE